MLQATYQGSATLYAVIRRISDATVWNNSVGALQTWSDGSLAQYAVHLTNQGGDLYQAVFPATIPAADYWIQYYVQASGAPATSDLIIGRGRAVWDGENASPEDGGTGGSGGGSGGGGAVVSAYALTSLVSVKQHLRITDTTQDDLLVQFINQASALVERWCDRFFIARDIVERYSLNRERVLNLRHYPVQQINRVAWGDAPCLRVQYTGTGVRAAIQATNDRVRLTTTSSTGVRTPVDFVYADYPTTSLIAAGINTLTGWIATTVINVASVEIHPVAGVDAAGLGCSLAYPDLDTLEYTPDFSAGQLSLRSSFWNAWFAGCSADTGDCDGARFNGPSRSLGVRLGRGRNVLCVDYRAGYETVPDDIALVVNQLVQDVYYRSRSDTTKRAESLGDYSYRVADSAHVPLLTAAHQAALSPYKDPVVGGVV